MQYTALYRKFRPTKFSDMVGQEHITKTLKQQIIAGRVGHAYLFSGGRGTGKTSSAKILARAINCEHSIDGEPCNECEICKAMLDGSLTDVVEMDAASNNSVDDIRNIIDNINFLPTRAKYRVYIIDEVHMLSTGAFNALLKTLEEPPEHVKFILATTEPQKLPATILSRCQRFDYKKINKEDIIKRLNIICKESNIKITEEALELIAVLSEGAMRDSISILERCKQEEDGEIDIGLIKRLVGIPETESISNLSKAILQKDTQSALENLKEILDAGRDINQVIWELIKYLRDILVYKTTSEMEIYNKEEIERIKKLTSLVDKQTLVNLIYDFSALENNIKWSSQKSIMLEAEVIKACNKYEKVEYQRQEEPKIKTDEKIEETKENNNESKTIEKEENIEEQKTDVKEERKKIKENSNQTIDSNLWNKVIEKTKQDKKMNLYIRIKDLETNIENDTLEILKDNIYNLHKTTIELPENKEYILETIKNISGKDINIKYIDELNKKDSKSDNLESLDLPINIID